MVFSSSVFLFFFLPAVLLLYYWSPKRARNPILLTGSYLFYAWGEPKILAILIVGSAIDYLIGNRIFRAAENNAKRKRLLGLSIALNLAALGYFKYANFFIGEAQNLLQLLGVETGDWHRIALPIGISFFTFQKISYLVDIYRGVTEPARSFVNYALYVSFFPQLIAGPIVRYHDINAQIEVRPQGFANVSDGFYRFARGLGKKVLLANPMAEVADGIFNQPIDTLPGHYIWIGAIAYTLQIYFDFSGYSDMAIGLARMFGFRLLENFNRPYISTTITEFWHRWHISLSNWMREYLYIPLGGNRFSKARTYFNLWFVFILSGLWHGANWNFIIWGGFHGTLLTIERAIGLENLKAIPRWIMQPITILLVTVGLVIFRTEYLGDAFLSVYRMFAFDTFMGDSPTIFLGDILKPRFQLILLTCAAIAFFPKWPIYSSAPKELRYALLPATWIVFFFSILSLAGSSYNPFIYFRF